MEGLDLGGVGNTSTFRRRRLPQFQQQSQTLARTAGINLMRGSMFQLNTASTSATTAASSNGSVDMEGRSGYGYGPRQTPMTPGPGRRAPVSVDCLSHKIHLSSFNLLSLYFSLIDLPILYCAYHGKIQFHIICAMVTNFVVVKK